MTALKLLLRRLPHTQVCVWRKPTDSCGQSCVAAGLQPGSPPSCYVRLKKRRNSKDFPPSFALETPLHQAYSEFRRLYEEDRGRLMEISNEMQQIPAEINRIVDKRGIWWIVGVTVGVLLATPLAVLTEGFISVFFLGLLGVLVAQSIRNLGSQITQKRAIKKIKNRVIFLQAEFDRIVQTLMERMQKFREKCEEQKERMQKLREKCEEQTERMQKLQQKYEKRRTAEVRAALLELQMRLKPKVKVVPKSAASASLLSDQFVKTLTELDQVKLLLETQALQACSAEAQLPMIAT